MYTLGIDDGGKWASLSVIHSVTNEIAYLNVLQLPQFQNKILNRRMVRRVRRAKNSKKKRLKSLRLYLNSSPLNPETRKKIYTLGHKRGWDYAEFDEEASQEENGNNRHRQEVLADVRSIITDFFNFNQIPDSETQINVVYTAIEKILNKRYRKVRFNNRKASLVGCKICGKNTPKKGAVKDFLFHKILNYKPLEPCRDEVSKLILKQGKPTKAKKEKIESILEQHNVNPYLTEQIINILENNKIGRHLYCTPCCIALMEGSATEEMLKKSTGIKQAKRIGPSTRAKIEYIISKCMKDVAPNFEIGKIVIEKNNFDILKIQKKAFKINDTERKAGWKEEHKTRKEALYTAQNTRCLYCGKKFPLAYLHEDHVWPRSKNRDIGFNHWYNIVLACSSCNSKKGNRTPSESRMLLDLQALTAIKKSSKLKGRYLEDLGQLDHFSFNKWIGRTSAGRNVMMQKLREVFGQSVQIVSQHGAITQELRKKWNFGRKERGPKFWYCHGEDAVILATNRYDTNALPHFENMTFEETREEIKNLKFYTKYKDHKGKRNSALTKLNSIRRRKIRQKGGVVKIIYGISKPGTEDVGLKKFSRLKPVADTNVMYHKGQYWQVENPNEAIAVNCSDFKVIKNRRVKKYMQSCQSSVDFNPYKNEATFFKKGDVICYKGEELEIVKILSSGKVACLPYSTCRPFRFLNHLTLLRASSSQQSQHGSDF